MQAAVVRILCGLLRVPAQSCTEVRVVRQLRREGLEVTRWLIVVGQLLRVGLLLLRIGLLSSVCLLRVASLLIGLLLLIRVELLLLLLRVPLLLGLLIGLLSAARVVVRALALVVVRLVGLQVSRIVIAFTPLFLMRLLLGGMVVLVAVSVDFRDACINAKHFLNKSDHGFALKVASVNVMDFKILDLSSREKSIAQKLSLVLIVIRMNESKLSDFV